MPFDFVKLAPPGQGASPGVMLRVDRQLVKGSEPCLSQSSFVLKLGRTVFLAPLENRLVILPISVHGEGLHGLFSCCYLRDVSATPILGKGGRITVRVHNFSDRLVTLSPKLKVVRGHFSGHGRLNHGPSLVSPLHIAVSEASERPDATGEPPSSSFSMSQWISLFPCLFAEKISAYGDSSTLQELQVRADELEWRSPIPFTDSGTPPCLTDCSPEAARSEIKSLLSRGIIRELSYSDRGFFSPVIFLKKPDGRVRIVVDFQRLNRYSNVWNTHTLDTRNAVRAVDPSWRFFTVLDLRDGYFHIPVDSSLSRLFCFSCFGRRFQFTTLPQGWASSAGFFNDRVRRILGAAPGSAYFDDIIIGGRDRKTHDRNLHTVLSVLQEAGMHINPRKIQFCRTSVKYLGFSVSGDSYHQRAYISSQLAQLPAVTSKKGLQRILGIFTACRGTCPGLGLAIAPLYAHLGSSVRQVDWNSVQDVVRSVAAVILRNSLTFLRCVESPVFHLEVDWSGAGAGYLLYAGHRSEHRLLATNCRTLRGFPVSSFLGELDAIVWCLQDTMTLTAGCPVHVHTDSLSALQKLSACDVWYKSRSDLRIGRRLGWLWANFPLNSRLFLHFLPSSDNYLADCLSRWPTLAQRKEVDLNALRREDGSRNRLKRIEKSHEGHWGVRKTLLNLKRDGGSLWAGMEGEVRRFVESCWKCQIWGKTQHRVDLGTTKADNIGDAVGIDFAGPLPTQDSEEPRYVILMVDYLSRWVEAWACMKPSSEAAVKALCKWQQKNGGIRMLISDNAQTWHSKDVKKWCIENGVIQRLTASYMPKSNGMCERQIGVLKGRLKRMSTKPYGWRKILPRAVRIMNHSVNETTLHSAAELKFGTTRDGKKVAERVRKKWIYEAQERTRRQQWCSNEIRRKKYGSRKPLRTGDHVLKPRAGADTGPFLPPWDDEPCVVMEPVGTHMWLIKGLVSGRIARVHDDQVRQIPQRTTAQLEACRRWISTERDGVPS